MLIVAASLVLVAYGYNATVSVDVTIAPTMNMALSSSPASWYGLPPVSQTTLAYTVCLHA